MAGGLPLAFLSVPTFGLDCDSLHQWHHGEQKQPHGQHVVGVGVQMDSHTELHRSVVVVVDAAGPDALRYRRQIGVRKV